MTLPRPSARWLQGFAAAVAIVLLAAPSAAAPGRGMGPDYMTDEFRTTRLLDWGTRPDWSPDGKRIAFTEAEFRDTHAYEIDVATREVRCLTCRYGMNGVIMRVYYLPDGSFLILASRDLAGPHMQTRASNRSDETKAELYWMPASADVAPRPLGTPACCEIAISSRVVDGATQIAWMSVDGGLSSLNLARLVRNGNSASMEGRRTLYDLTQRSRSPHVTVTETYGFKDNDTAIYFWTMDPASGKIDGEMYQIDIASGKLAAMYLDPWHNETHLFPDERFGLEESNRASDPSGAWRGVSAQQGPVVSSIAKRLGLAPPAEPTLDYAPFGSLKGFGRPFDLFIVSMEYPSKRRQLTDVGRFGVNAGQSAPSPDGRRIAYAIDPRANPEMVNDVGLYVGEFVRK